jgi:6-phosphogluconolactonase
MNSVTRGLLMIMAGIGAASPVLCAAQPGPKQPGTKAGAVFVMTNAADKNQILTFERAANGTLTSRQAVDTGGRGSGGVNDPLEAQGSLTLSQDHSLVFAVNAGSGTVSTFRVNGADLDLSDQVPSGGLSVEPSRTPETDCEFHSISLGKRHRRRLDLFEP